MFKLLKVRDVFGIATEIVRVIIPTTVGGGTSCVNTQKQMCPPWCTAHGTKNGCASFRPRRFRWMVKIYDVIPRYAQDKNTAVRVKLVYGESLERLRVAYAHRPKVDTS